MKHTRASNKSLFWQALIISIVQGIMLSDFIVFCFFSTNMISSCIFSVSADSPHCVSCSGGIRDNGFLLYYKSSLFPELQYSPVFAGHLTKHPNVCNSPLITKQPDSPVAAAAQPDESIVLLCFWSELCGADCQGTARHFSASMAANLQIAPCRPKLMEGQFGGLKGLNSRTCAPIFLWVWIYFLTFAARYPLLTSTFIASPHTYYVPLSAAHYMW